MDHEPGTRSMGSFARFALNADGEDVIEYGLLIGIITLAVVLAINAVGAKVTAYFRSLDTAMP
jgi:Flp pilus assembly pilin Flp